MTTPQPAALPELPEKLIFSERLAISEAAQVPMDAECCRVIQATLDYISSNYALAALQPQPAAAVSDEEILHIVDTHVGEPTPRYPLKASDWINFARAILALRPQAVPMPEPVKRLSRYAGQTMRTARNPNITAREAIEIGDYLAAIGITAQGAQGEQG